MPTTNQHLKIRLERGVELSIDVIYSTYESCTQKSCNVSLALFKNNTYIENTTREVNLEL
jgi:hypothetical protein